VTRRRRTLWTSLAFLILLVALTAWIGVRAVLARQHLLKARDEVSQLRAQVSAGELDGLAAGLARIQHEASAAKSLTSDPVWAGLSDVPVLGRTLAASTDLADSVQQLADQTLAPLINVSKRLDPKDLRKPDGSIDLARLTAAGPDIDRANSSLTKTVTAIRKQTLRGVLGPVVKAHNQLTDQLAGLIGTIDTANRAAKIGPAMLGATGVRRYLMVFQTPAESRGTGGLVGSYAIIKIANGKITRERTGSDDELRDSDTSVVNFGAEFNNRYANTDETLAWRNANFTPHYPYAAEIWQRLYEKQFGGKIDGVLSADPITLGYLLGVSGPVTLSDGEVINGENAATWSLITSYAHYPDPANQSERKKLLVELATQTLDKLSSGNGGSTALLKVLGRAAGERRLLLWSAHPAEEAVLSGTPLAGELPNAPGPFTALVMRNRSGSKLDVYVDRKLDYQVLSCNAKTRIVEVTATLTNTAPQGLGAYVRSRADGRKVPYGEDRVVTSIYATKGSTLNVVWINGKRSGVVAATERGLPVYGSDLELPIGKPQTIKLQLTEPRSKARVSTYLQPLARPLAFTAGPRTCK
jgi:hypothetical protein